MHILHISVTTRIIIFIPVILSFFFTSCDRNKKPEERTDVVLPFDKPIRVNVEDAFNSLVAEEDTDKDKKITVDDKQLDMPGPPDRARGDKVFVMPDVAGRRYRIEGTYPLSVLLQELALAKDRGEEQTTLDPAVIHENPVDRISRLIREVYWDNLTRAVDEEHMPKILEDTKTTTVDGNNYLYVPHDDKMALDYFNDVAGRHPEWKLKVVRLPEKITPEYVRDLDGRHGLLTLKLEEKDGKIRGVPYVVPGGRFNEMYGWDSYFIVLGLLVDGRVELAKSMVDNHVYQINHYGKILNANRSYYLTRSQPPFLTSMALAVYEKLPKNDETKEWLADVMRAAIKEYETVWMSPPRYVPEVGLSRYYGEGIGPCPEVEPGHYDHIIKPYADKEGVTPGEYLEGYKQGEYKSAELVQFFIHDRAVRESGHDTTYRFDDRTADFVTVDLNSLLYKYEFDVVKTINEVFVGELTLREGKIAKSESWIEKAKVRRSNILSLMFMSGWPAHLWVEADGSTRHLELLGDFYDYDFENKKQSQYISATKYYPAWACIYKRLGEDIKKLVIPIYLGPLENLGGIASSAKDSRGYLSIDRPQRQWDYPYGWPPHQMMVWQGLRNYGFDEDADRLTYKWLYMITKNAADYNGTIPEKFDVVERTHDCFAEYGNVGVKFDYITKEGFGWMNASYQAGLKSLPPHLVEELRKLTPPEELFER
jgi:alpha,alpha-trehalase